MKTYLIVGGSSGIGAAVVEELAQENSVIATYCKNYKKYFTFIPLFHLNLYT